jgi:hypothetical protein
MMAGRVPLDPDAQAFLNAAGITDNSITAAIDTLVLDLKGYGIWNKMKAIYPFVGGTASTHKFNLKNPVDIDAAFRLVFNGGITHSSTGLISNGTNGFYTTKFNNSINGSQNNQSAGIYVRTNLNGGPASLDFGNEFAGGALLQIYAKVDIGLGQQFGTRLNDATYQGQSNLDSRGFYAISRTSSANYLKQIDTSISTISQASTGLANAEILGFKNSTTYTPREQAFAFIGDGLTNTEMSNYYTAVQAFQTTLGRQV